VPRREKYVPRHRNTPAEPALKKGLRKSFVFSGVAVAATGITVGSGVLSQDEVPASTAASSLSSATSDQADGPSVDTDAAEREQQTSRSDRRESLDPEKKKALSQDPGGAVTRTEDIASQDPRDIARSLLPKYGFSQSEFGCLDELYVSESNWNMHADNPTSSAYGIPQALPGSKMASAGSDWATNPVTQIRWGLGYIQDRYGSPCGAWAHSESHGWY